MLRNREIRIFLLIQICILLATAIAAYIFPAYGVFFVLFTGTLLIISNILMTLWRYKEMEKLSSDLRRIASGDSTLDVRDNQEGEISILKSDIYKVTIKLSEHRAQLQRDQVKLTDAISDISHQIKTPLTSMMVMADVLHDRKLDDSKRVEFTRNIRIQLERMDWLVTSLLKLSKMDAGAIQFKKNRVDVGQLIQKAADPILIPMDIKEQNLLIEGNQQSSFLGDLNWTAEALINILKNGVEHTPDGGKISIAYSENALYTEIIISDNGKGISKKDLPYIFKRFYKGENVGEDSVGIGLAMAYSIVKGQNGDIEVSSEIGKGTRFHIKFYKQVM
ncbi:signal transduction histidine kinase [Bacillus mesophilus]|uniref:sensor histidine kinase n=1 Tax=Bacillus mesophilus TaxID=1808955 RepID=UPI0030845760|nr:signal transduction histidine kinase [Bacillus mesophilus]